MHKRRYWINDLSKQGNGMNNVVSSPCVKNLSFFIVSWFSVKIELFKLRQVESWKETQKIPDSVEFVEWMALGVAEDDAWEINKDRSCWHCLDVKGKDLGCDAFSDWPESPLWHTWLAMDTLPFCLYPGGKPINL